MALLSVIVPVFRVEKYLAECLGSLLVESGVDFEVIAVDDGSDDGSSEIVAGYAARDSRLTVVTHEQNQGLGAARNTGLARASGDYVWFVDSDDWLPDGALDAVAEQLTRTRPDVLITAFTRYYWDGRVRHESLAKVGGGQQMPDTFTLRQQPDLLAVLHIACNKVVRRDFLAEIGLTFGPGWYEDVSFSFPLLLAAERIGLLDRCCYAYRQRPDGAITHTVSPRHLEVFAHWDRVFAFMGTRPNLPPELHRLIFRRMIWHLLVVFGHERRVPAANRRAFFAEMSARYRAHLPATGYQRPPGGVGLKHRLIGLGAYRLFEALRITRRVRAGVVRRIRGPRTRPTDSAAAADVAATAAAVPVPAASVRRAAEIAASAVPLSLPEAPPVPRPGVPAPPSGAAPAPPG